MRRTAMVSRFWQLLSGQLPVGGFQHSQGLETAIARGWVNDVDSLETWIGGLGSTQLASTELPIQARAMDAFSRGAIDEVAAWDRCLRACRDGAEQRRQDESMGRALDKLLAAWNEPVPPGMSFPVGFALAGWCAKVAPRDVMRGYAFTWLENLIVIAVRLVPLGHVAGQRSLRGLLDSADEWVDHALVLDDAGIGRAAPGAFLASAWHETQSPRLFVS